MKKVRNFVWKSQLPQSFSTNKSNVVHIAMKPFLFAGIGILGLGLFFLVIGSRRGYIGDDTFLNLAAITSLIGIGLILLSVLTQQKSSV